MITKVLILFLSLSSIFMGQTNNSTPIVNENLVFEEKNGIAAVEAEYFYKQSLTEIRKWYITSKDNYPNFTRDADGPHVYGASNNAYIEILPDTRKNHGEQLINGINFSNEPGKLAILHYKVYINNPGRYYVWVRAHSTGSEDNGIHVGLNGEWPESGQRLQWCEGKQTWRWESKQRTAEVHCGEPYLIYIDIEEAGLHDIQFSMREDGFEFDKWFITKDREFIRPDDIGPVVNIKNGNLPDPFPAVAENEILNLSDLDYNQIVSKSIKDIKFIKAKDFPIENTNYYVNDNWLAINPEEYENATTEILFPYENGMYDIVLLAVGENDGKSKFAVSVKGDEIGKFTCPLSEKQFEEGPKYNQLWENISINTNDKISVYAEIASEKDEFSRGRWAGIAFLPLGKGKELLSTAAELLEKQKLENAFKVPQLNFTNPLERKEDGKGSVKITGELKEWHKVTLTLDGPFAHELDLDPNPFKDYRMMVHFEHETGNYEYQVPGYFAADGNAAETSADRGTKWKAHFSPDEEGKWKYSISFIQGPSIAVYEVSSAKPVNPYNGITGEFTISKTDKKGNDFRSKGRLQYVGKHHLRFSENGEYFLKAGPDAPETFLAYKDFDATYTLKNPIKLWEPHYKDWTEGDPIWQNKKGKGIIGAVNYLAEKGVNAVSFLTYNAGGDGDNVWPFVKRNAKLNYDCSKLDQWQIVFDHAQSKGIYLHFKTQETENDDHKRGKNFKGIVPEALDAGFVKLERKIYYRELIARYGYLLALNWNLGEENTQTNEARRNMAKYFAENDPFKHNIVIHTFPGQQDTVYNALVGKQSLLTGVSLQNEWDHTHKRTLQWVKNSREAGRPWIVANDEQGSASEGVPPDPNYRGFKAEELGYDLHDIRKQTLWGNLMAGGAGVEYYFGYRLPENDLVCEDYRSRDMSWDYCKIAINFFKDNSIPFWNMKNRNELIGNENDEKEKYCLTDENENILVYLGYSETTDINLEGFNGTFDLLWFNPREGGEFSKGSVLSVEGGNHVNLGTAPNSPDKDWLIILKKRKSR